MEYTNFTDDQLAKILWDYHKLNQKLVKADAIYGLGSHDLGVPKRCAELYKKDWAPRIIFSGGYGRITKDDWKISEAGKFKQIAIEQGVSERDIYVEDKSTNTGENITFTKELIQDKNLKFDKVIIVNKPYAERRTYATIKKQWPELDFIVTSQDVTYEDYLTDPDYKVKSINIMVGDLQRIRVYPEKGFQIEQEIPEEVDRSYDELVRRGYTGQLVS